MDWKNHWKEKKYIQNKEKFFNIIDNYLSSPPIRILDIGCGFAYESEMFQKKYKSELYLLDGEFDNTKRETLYGSVDSFGYYNKIEELKRSYDERNMNYTFVDGNDIKIPDDMIFDLIISIQSCGFHYPADTYRDLINKYSNENTKIILDIRKNTNQNSFKEINILATSRKCDTIELKFQ